MTCIADGSHEVLNRLNREAGDPEADLVHSVNELVTVGGTQAASLDPELPWSCAAGHFADGWHQTPRVHAQSRIPAPVDDDWRPCCAHAIGIDGYRQRNSGLVGFRFLDKFTHQATYAVGSAVTGVDLSLCEKPLHGANVTQA